MIFISKEFDAALEAELQRLINEKIADYKESQEFCELLDKAVQHNMDNFYKFIYFDSPAENLKVVLSAPDTESEWSINIEKLIDDEIARNQAEILQIILARLELLTMKVRVALSPNAD